MTDHITIPRALLEQALEALSVSTTPLARDRQTVLGAIHAIGDELAKPVEPAPVPVSEPLHPQYIAGFKSGAYAARRRMDLNPETAPRVEIRRQTCPLCNESFAAFSPVPATAPDQPAWHDAPTCAGLWVSDYGRFEVETVNQDDVNNFDTVYNAGGRWYGPIPRDKKGGAA